MKKQFQFLFIFAAMILCCGNVWGGNSHSTHYGIVTAVTMGNGTVYLSTSSTEKTGGSESAATASASVSQTWNCGSSSDSDSKTYYAYATAANGYHFVGWSTSNTSITDTNSGANAYAITQTASSTYSGSPSTKTIYAYFEANPQTKVTLSCPNGAMGSLTYKCDGVTKTITEQTVVETNSSFNFTANAKEGYRVLRWWKSEDGGATKTTELVDSKNFDNQAYTKDCMIGVDFVAENAPIFQIKGKKDVYTDLNAANNAASSGDIIVLISDGTLPSGNYTIDKNKTLLIPFNAEYTCYTDIPGASHGHETKTPSGATNDYKNDQSFVYKMLTLANGAKLVVNGTISVSAMRWCAFDTGSSGASLPNVSGVFRIHQGYGCITLNEGSNITLNNGSYLYCWGRIRGDGTITAENGSEVRESWVFTDWRNNDYLMNYTSKSMIFPMNQYYVQDIQASITFKPGSKEILKTGMFAMSSQPVQFGEIAFIGDANSKGLFVNSSSSNSSVTKKYDVATDRLIWDLEGGASISTSELNIKGVVDLYFTTVEYEAKAATDKKILPITNNWTININSGEATIKSDFALTAGAIINIQKDATLKVLSGASMYVYDADDWVWEGSQKYGKGFASGRRIIPLFLPSCEIKLGTYKKQDGSNWDKIYTYQGREGYLAIRKEADMLDAEILVNGTLIIEGGENVVYQGADGDGQQTQKYSAVSPRDISGLYTTNGAFQSSTILSSGGDKVGAKIYSTEAGQITYNQGSGTQNITYQLYKGTDYGEQASINIVPAKLQQGNGEYYSTANYTSETTFKYFGTGTDGKWGKVSNVKFMDGDTKLLSQDYAEGETIIAPTPEKDGYKFLGWDKEVSIMGAADITYNAVWEKQIESLDVTAEQVVITDGDTEHPTDLTDNENTYIVEENLGVQTVIVEDGAKVDVTEDASLNVAQTLILNASENSSGDLVGVGENVTVADDANVYFDYDFNTPAIRWNAIAFPWQIDATAGVKVGDQTLTLGTDFDVIYYDGQKRSEDGPVQDCWRYVEDDIADNVADAEILVPGKLYMILFAKAQNVVRFAKIANTPLNNTDVNVVEYGTGGNDANWNGIANPTMYHAYLDAGVEDGQTYNNADRSYEPISFAEENLPVGKPVFVQAANAQSVVISKDAPSSAPLRLAANQPIVRAEVEIKFNNVATDKVIIRIDEDAADEYTLGSDLSKAGVSNSVAQMWINRYDAKLCKNTIAPVENVAEYPLTIFAPTSGDYTLALRKNLDTDVALYLTQNGEVIANLTQTDITIKLTNGNTNAFGLRLVVKTQPGVVTSLDEALTTKKAVDKVIYRGNLYIIHDGKVFNAQGARL